MTDVLSLDFETYSTIDLTEVGPARYAEDPTTGIWCVAYRLGTAPVMVQSMETPLPAPVRTHLEQGGLIRAWNADFERRLWTVATRRYHWPAVTPAQFVCSAALAARAGLPRKLEHAAKALGLPVQKDMAGHRLMMRACRPTKSGGWYHFQEGEWDALLAYCAQDVTVECAVVDQLPKVGHPFERSLFLLDQTINDRGVRIDRPLVRAALRVTEEAVEALNVRLNQVSAGELDRVTQVARITGWVQRQGVPVESLDKGTLRDLLATQTMTPEVEEVLRIRQDGGKSSVAKLRTMLLCALQDDRIRGLLRYYGASTGRWSGQLVQPQNFPRGTVPVTEPLLDLIRTGDWEAVEMHLERDVRLMDLMASMLRSCFVAAPGHDLIAADFSAIEARVLGWLANAEKLLESYRSGGSAYLDMSEVIYGRRVSKKHDPLEYQVSKNTVLGCGYQMGAERFAEQLQEQTGIVLDPALAKRAVESYRSLYWQVPQLWRGMNETVQVVVSGGVTSWTPVAASQDRLAFAIDESGWLKLRLPSGRCLWYPEPRMSKRKAPWGDLIPCVTTAGVNPITKQWGRQALYGGLLVENADQATARDLLGEAMLRVEAAGYPVVLSVHDEAVAEVPEGQGSVEEFETLMATPPAWAADCPIGAEGWRGKRYRK